MEYHGDEDEITECPYCLWVSFKVPRYTLIDKKTKEVILKCNDLKRIYRYIRMKKLIALL
jgi:hypothetical protein